MAKKKAAKKTGAAAIAVVEGDEAPGKVTKSGLIRDYLAQNPGVQNKGVADALNGNADLVAKGFTFKASDVAQVKVNDKKKGGTPAKAGRKPGAKVAASNGKPTGAVAIIAAARALITAAGSAGEAKAVIDAMGG